MPVGVDGVRSDDVRVRCSAVRCSVAVQCGAWYGAVGAMGLEVRCSAVHRRCWGLRAGAHAIASPSLGSRRFAQSASLTTTWLIAYTIDRNIGRGSVRSFSKYTGIEEGAMKLLAQETSPGGQFADLHSDHRKAERPVVEDKV
jgi:hypothetical protein